MKKLDNLKAIADANLDKLDLSPESKTKLKNEAKLKKNKTFKRLGFIGLPSLAAVLAFIVFFSGIFDFGGAKVYASDLMKGIKPQKVESVTMDQRFIKPTANFSIELFKQGRSRTESSLISPVSVFLALGMTANGADGNTLKQFEALLGNGEITMKDLNEYYYSLSKNLLNNKSGRMNIANSIWYRKDESLKIKEDFLQTNANYYNAAAYESDFDSINTIKDINNWVKNNTGDMIDKIIDRIDPDTIMYLINAVYFDNQWETAYEKKDIHEGTFNLADGKQKSVEYMYSEEVYLKDDMAQGFKKTYNDGDYSFVAMLPNEGVSLDSYIDYLSGERFVNMLKNPAKEAIRAGLPKFTSEFKVGLVEPLKKMGLKDCFDYRAADFKKMGSSLNGNIFISDVLHKTFITVDAKGTKAGAVTKVEMQTKSVSITRNLVFNRPFVYAIVDNHTNLPIFIGTMMNPVAGN